jgi:FtsH-binding integral membrane protein
MAKFDRQRATMQTDATHAHEVDAGLRAYMMKVYNFMALGVGFTAIVSLYVASNPALMQAVALGPMKWILFIGVLGLGWFAGRLIFSGNTMLAHLCFWGYAGLWGLLISPMIHFYMGQDPGLIVRAFAITSVTFGATSLYGYVAKKDLSRFGTFFMMASIGLIVAMLVNAFFVQSSMMSLLVSGAVVLLFAAITAWETQAIKELYYHGDDHGVVQQKSIFGAFLLYGSFITLFIHILNILGIMRD